MAPGLDTGFTEGSGFGEAGDLLDGLEVVDADDVLNGLEADPGAFADDLFLFEFPGIDAFVDGGGMDQRLRLLTIAACSDYKSKFCGR